MKSILAAVVLTVAMSSQVYAEKTYVGTKQTCETNDMILYHLKKITILLEQDRKIVKKSF